MKTIQPNHHQRITLTSLPRCGWSCIKSQSNALTLTPCNCSLFPCLTLLSSPSHTLSFSNEVKKLFPSSLPVDLIETHPHSQSLSSFLSSDPFFHPPKIQSSANKLSKSLLLILLHFQSLPFASTISFHWDYNLSKFLQSNLLGYEALFIILLCFYISEG